MAWKFIKPRVAPLNECVIVVSGLPRSGTSMMMKMLIAGGLPALTDGLRGADENNPKGYFELEQVKQLPGGDTGWVQAARGKVVKVISYLLESLPAEVSYRVIFMQRDLDEVLASQKRMLDRDGKPEGSANDEQMADLYKKHLTQVEAWLARQANMQVLFVSYNGVMQSGAEAAERVNRFLGGGLDTEAMAAVVDLACTGRGRGSSVSVNKRKDLPRIRRIMRNESKRVRITSTCDSATPLRSEQGVP